MKKIISLLLVLAMVLSMGVTSVFAAEIGGNWGDGTVVTYNADATATEYYTVTVPASLDPGDGGTVTAEGKFPSNMTLTVTADTSVSLSDGISTKTLGVSFAGIELVGSNTAAVSASNSVAVANWSDEVKAPLFGEWKGTFNYFVELVEESTDDDSDSGSDSATYAATFADNSWADIAVACQNNEVPDTWSVGDTKTMTINGAEYDVAIIGKNYDTYADGSGVAPLTFMLIKSIGVAAMNSTNTTDGGWPASEMRSMLHETVINTLEDDVKNNIKAVKKTTVAGKEDQTGNSLVYDKSEDKLFLLSDEEFSSSSTRYEYFNETHFNSSNPLYNKYWWLRSPWSNYKGMFELHSYADSFSGNSPATTTSNYMFGFCF